MIFLDETFSPRKITAANKTATLLRELTAADTGDNKSSTRKPISL